MSRAQAEKIRELQDAVRGLREQVGEMNAERRGEDRGRWVVAEQLANDVRLGTLREERHRKNSARSHGDLQRALRLVAAHILDVRGSAAEPEAAEHAELLAEEFETAGIPLRSAFIAVQIERADAGARVTAAEAAAAVTNAPAPRPVPAAATH